MVNKSETLFFVHADIGHFDSKGINFIRNHVGGLPYIAKIKPTDSKALRWDIDRSDVYYPSSSEASDFAVWVNSQTDVHVRHLFLSSQRPILPFSDHFPSFRIFD